METLKKHANYLAVLILAIMFFLALGSMKNDSAIRDEMPHIVAGYSYLTKFDYRINPEHPPLVKQLSALPLLFLNLNFPAEDPAWKDNVNDQWTLGNIFLYHSGNDADKMLFWGRIPIVILMLITGWIIFKWTNEIFKNKVAGLISLTLFAISPNIIAHGRFITTDMGVTAFSVFALYSWWRFLKDPSGKKFIVASLLQAGLHLAKFSSPLFLPIIGLMAIIAIFYQKPKWSLAKKAKLYIGATVLATIIAYVVVGVWYQVCTFKMPLEVQQNLIEDSIADSDFRNAGLATKLTKMTEFYPLRPYAQYLLGFVMVAAHASYGHSTYFMGETGQNWPEYYFVAYLLKEPLASQILFVSAFLILVSVLFTFLTSGQKRKKLEEGLKKYSILIPFGILILLYMIMGMKAKLQLGIRYIVPIFPYFYIMVGGIIVFQLNQWKGKKILSRVGWGFVSLLIVWLFWANLKTYPYYLAYFNEIIGGPQNGWQYLVDSNIDWGQDLRRLKKYLDDNNIQEIKIDYFGGGDVSYYLGEKDYELWGFDKGATTGWLAVSINAIQWNSSNQGDQKSYHWLTDNHEPIERVGHSIFLYYLPEK
jgi:4-amino-4-deoxy-L-arabinose transferase-like glycosyltransferase